MNIKPDDLVLEIGSGNNPNPRSDILCDRYLTDNSERAGGFPIVIDRPFVRCDAYALPFADKTFDYVICSHILEHMDDPKKFIAEVTRVGKAGYIEVPSAVSERIFGWSIHHWYCRVEKKGIILAPKSDGERFGGFFHRLIETQFWFRRYIDAHKDVIYSRLEWRESCPIRVEKSTREAYLTRLDTEANIFLRGAVPRQGKDLAYFMQWLSRR
ncbi:MAG: methyltransferase domain-containing protein, partial [bacterium]|nr:methyltransferase domain-containing protein [bacterium]